MTPGALKAALRQAWERGATRSDYSGLVKRLQERNERSGYLTITQVRKIAQEGSHSQGSHR